MLKFLKIRLARTSSTYPGPNTATEMATPIEPMIGTRTAGSTAPLPSSRRTVVPIIGTKRGRGHAYAEAFAARFLAWLADQPEATMMLPDEVVIEMAAKQFAPAAGMPMPPPRNLLSVLKRTPGVQVKPNVRVRDGRGDVIGKTTMYLLVPAGKPRIAA
jgi:hypothetical protein